MKIEKLVEPELSIKEIFSSSQYIGLLYKINEIIDAINEIEQNRSEQMARIIRKLDLQEKYIFDIKNRNYSIYRCLLHKNFPCNCLNTSDIWKNHHEI